MPLDEPQPRTSSTSENVRYLDSGRIIQANSASALVYTILNDADGKWTPGDWFGTYAQGAGAVSIAAGSGVTLNTPASYPAAEQYQTLVAYRVGSNEWTLA